MNKEPNVYLFNDECYVYLEDYKQLQNNWNELKEIVTKEINYTKSMEDKEYTKEINLICSTYEYILYKMQEIESRK